METITEDHAMWSRYHESLDERKVITSVSSSASALYVQADHFILRTSAIIYGLTASDTRISNRFGPTPRICFDFLKHKDTLAQHEGDYESALQGFSSEKLHTMVLGARQLSMDAGSYTIVLMKRMDVNDDADWGCASVEPITHAVKIALRNQL